MSLSVPFEDAANLPAACDLLKAKFDLSGVEVVPTINYDQMLYEVFLIDMSGTVAWLPDVKRCDLLDHRVYYDDPERTKLVPRKS